MVCDQRSLIIKWCWFRVMFRIMLDSIFRIEGLVKIRVVFFGFMEVEKNFVGYAVEFPEST